jgi:hypothetical protein
MIMQRTVEQSLAQCRCIDHGTHLSASSLQAGPKSTAHACWSFICAHSPYPQGYLRPETAQAIPAAFFGFLSKGSVLLVLVQVSQTNATCTRVHQACVEVIAIFGWVRETICH